MISVDIGTKAMHNCGTSTSNDMHAIPSRNRKHWQQLVMSCLNILIDSSGSNVCRILHTKKAYFGVDVVKHVRGARWNLLGILMIIYDVSNVVSWALMMFVAFFRIILWFYYLQTWSSVQCLYQLWYDSMSQVFLNFQHSVVP